MRRKKSKSLILFFLALISHLPFLWAGYGREEDAWAQALNAKIIWETGVYEVSRLPGHPHYELLLAALWPIEHSYFLFNFLSALATSFAVVFFFRIALRFRVNNPFTLSLAFIFVPVIFVAGNYTIDYNFALCFILASFLSLMNRRFLLAGILLGIATGFRISSIGFLLPLTIILWQREIPVKKWLSYWISAGIVGFLSFLTPLVTYGLNFIDFHKPPLPSWASVVYELSFGIWGVPLLIVLAYLLLLLIFRKKRTLRFAESSISQEQLIAGVVLIWLMQLVVFIRLPFKAEFFIPAIPFLFLLCGMYFTNNIRLLAAASFLSCFMFGFDYTNPYRGTTPSPLALTFDAGGKKVFFDVLQGPAILDLQKRNNKSHFVNEILEWQNEREEPAWVIAGWYWPELVLKTSDTSLVKFDYYSTEKELKQASDGGREIFYLPEINEANANINAHYLADSLGKELNLVE